jgi:peptide/nickel transport system substrate-binding protein
MEEPQSELHGTFSRSRRLPFFHNLSEYIKGLRTGDRFLFSFFALLVVIASIASLLSLEKKVLIEQPAYGGSLSEGVVESPRFINPLLALSDSDKDLSALTYAGLMGTGADGALTPVLAESYIISPDGRTYQFTIRPSAKFSDGTPVTADDVVYTVKKAQDPALKSPQAVNWNTVTATALDTHTVQFTLKTAYAPFIYDTTLGILPAHLWRNVTDQEFPFTALETKPVGAGPFIPSKSDTNAKGDIATYTFIANKSYPLGRPYLDSISFTFYPDEQALQLAMKGGKVESAYGTIGKNVLRGAYSRVFAIFLNPASDTTSASSTGKKAVPAPAGIFAKLGTRQALSLAIDRTAIVQGIFGGYATPLIGPVPAGSGIASDAIPQTDSATLTNLLTSSGWIYSATTGTWLNGAGTPLAINLKTSNVPELKLVAQHIQSNWQAIHVPTSLQFYEPGDLAQDVIRPRAFQALLFGMVIGKGTDLYDFWDSKAVASPGLNITNYSNPAVDTLLTDLRTQTDTATRIQELASVNSLISKDYPAVFIESPDFVYTVPKDLKGVILPLITSPSDRFASVATWYRRSESVWPFFARTNTTK